MISEREIPAADRAFEQDVADDRQLRIRVVEDHVPWCVAGAVADIQNQFANGHRVAIVKPAIRLERFAMKAPATAVLRQLRDPEAVGLVWAFNGNPELLCEDARLARVIDMTVGEQDFFYFNSRLLSS